MPGPIKTGYRNKDQYKDVNISPSEYIYDVGASCFNLACKTIPASSAMLFFLLATCVNHHIVHVTHNT